jgi:type IV secretion system pilin
MKKILRIFMVTAALAGLLLAPLVLSETAIAQDAAKEAACEGIGGCDDDGASIDEIILRLIQVMSAIAGVAAVIMIIISGFRFITANGDAATVAAARRTLMYALVGLLVVLMSQAIVWFILQRVTASPA